MKECPNCKQVFADDLSYCLQDGTPLTEIGVGIDRYAPTEASYGPGVSDPTQVLHRNEPIEKRAASKLPYFLIGALTVACVALAAAVVATNLDRILPTRDTKGPVVDKVVSSPGVAPSATPLKTPAITISANSPDSATPVVTYDPTGKWKGKWSTDSGTLFDFELDLRDTGNNGLQGSILWTMRKSVRADKMDKVGLSATEYVKGSYEPATGLVNLKGYSKNDPNNMLVMIDVYKLNISSDGDTLTGNARNGGKWNGHIKLTR